MSRECVLPGPAFNQLKDLLNADTVILRKFLSTYGQTVPALQVLVEDLAKDYVDSHDDMYTPRESRNAARQRMRKLNDKYGPKSAIVSQIPDGTFKVKINPRVRIQLGTERLREIFQKDDTDYSEYYDLLDEQKISPAKPNSNKEELDKSGDPNFSSSLRASQEKMDSIFDNPFTEKEQRKEFVDRIVLGDIAIRCKI